jgi:phage terminase Nu1 subunit (DNA packaging protein)
MDEQPKKQQDIIEMAKKRRHLHLVEKLARGKSSTPALKKTEIRELEEFEKGPGKPGTVDSQEKVAKAFGVAVRTVERWAREGMPVTSRGEYDLIEIRSWRDFKKQKSTPGSSTKKNLEYWDGEFREWKAKKMKKEYMELMGQLIPRASVEKDLIRISLSLKRAFLSLPRTVAPQLAGLDPREIESILSKRVKEIIALFATGEIFKTSSKKIKDAKTVDVAENLE